MLDTRISCDGLMARLAEEIIEDHDTGESGSDVGDIVTALLAYQRKATKVTEGAIGVSGTRALAVTNKSILAAFIQLHESVGGYLSVDNDWKLQWPTTIGEDKGQQIRYRKNLKGITRDIDYLNYCTKLHLESSDESLSDISIGPVDVDVDTDASYGYIQLKETYAAYLQWVGAGEALPDNVTIFKQNAAPSWIKPSSVDSAPGWTNSNNCKDDDWDTYGYSNEILGGDAWTNAITMSIASGFYSSGKYKVHHTGDSLRRLEISVYDGADWTVIYNANPSEGSEKEFDFAPQTVEKIKLRAYFDYYDTGTFKLYECHLLQADVSDDSAVWEQGADERTVRCAIGDYDGAATYQIAYTYANYLVAWDKITTADDIVARLVTNKYEAYSLSLLEAGILILDEMKEVPKTYDINTVDLSKSQDFDFSFDALVIGSQVRVINEELGIDDKVRIVKMIHLDLLYPERMELQLSTRVKDISDYLADLHKEF